MNTGNGKLFTVRYLIWRFGNLVIWKLGNLLIFKFPNYQITILQNPTIAGKCNYSV